MDWIAKVNRLRGRQKLASIERDAGWARSSLSAAMSRGSTPNAAHGVRLAHALGVPAGWLFDDNEGWPPSPDVVPKRTALGILRAAIEDAGIDTSCLKGRASGYSLDIASSFAKALDDLMRDVGRRLDQAPLTLAFPAGAAGARGPAGSPGKKLGKAGKKAVARRKKAMKRTRRGPGGRKSGRRSA